MGFDVDSLTVPERIFETPSLHGKLSRDYIEEALNYYKKRLKEFL